MANARATAPSAMRPLGDFARCMRGIATGANDFFTLNREAAKRWKLPSSVLKPCVVKANHVPEFSFELSHLKKLGDEGRRVFLLDAPIASSASVARYIAHGERLGLHQRYLTRHRTPWYACERREPADIWVTVFGRARMRFVRNAARALNLTPFHGIYLRSPYRRHIGLLMEYFQSDAFAEAAQSELRVYADGLLKWEPRDVERLLVPDLDRL